MAPSGPSTTDYGEIQQNEVEALRSIFMDDFQEDEVKKGAWNKSADRAFRIRLKPFSIVDEDYFVILSITFSATYPNSLPRCTYGYSRDVRQKTRQNVESLVRARLPTLVGSEMIFEVTTLIQETLEEAVQARGHDVPALDEERALQAAAAQQETREAEEKRQQELQEVGEEEERALQALLAREQARQAKHNIAPRDASEAVEPELTVAGGTTFDQRVQARNPMGEVVNFSTVYRKVHYRSGPITDSFTVQPNGSSESSTPFLILKQCTHANSADDVRSKRSIQSLESKLEQIMKLEAHPSILKPLGYQLQRGSADAPGESWTVNILLELKHKGSMKDLLETTTTLDVANVRSWTIQVIEGLEFYHRHRVYHASLSVSNVLLEKTENGATVIKLCDGAYQHDLHIMKEHSNRDFSSASSAYWTAPESYSTSSGNYTAPTDIWDLGVLILQMLFGLDVQRSYASPNALMESLNLSQSLEDLISRLFRADAKKRPSAFDLLPHEFLRNDDPALDQQSSPSISRMASSTSFVPSKPSRMRRSSANTIVSSSRYVTDFVEAGRLGRGGFGEVVRARNKLDGRFYAIKKISQNSASALSGVLSEIILLSRLNHPNVVRYYTAWLEEEKVVEAETDDETIVTNQTPSFSLNGESHAGFSNNTSGLDFISSSGYPKVEFGYESDDKSTDEAVEDTSSESDDGQLGHNKVTARSGRSFRRRSSAHVAARKTTLYIQMEYCEKQTLRDLIRRDLHSNSEECWRLFRQILEGLVHVHGSGIIHRDLKPDNIFIDLSDNVRIGDFGLARPGDYQASNRPQTTGSTDPSLTRSIGTAFYVAPEVSSQGRGTYNEKADMYSLGVILFEMCFPLKTAMERTHTLNKLRDPNYMLPAAFKEPDKSIQGEIIGTLIEHKPSDRPSSIDLLRSGKVPIQAEDETIRLALLGLSDAKSPYHARLMSALFSQPVQPANMSDYTYDVTAASSITCDDLMLQSYVKETLVAVFRRHGAVEVHRSLLLPNSEYYSSNAVRLLNASGSLVQLPFDLTLPNARSLAKQPSPGRKTYTFGDVFRESPTGGHPRSHGEVDFDILSFDNLDLALREAEVIKVVDEIINAFPSLQSAPMCYHINHSRLLDSILKFCDIHEPKFAAVKEVMSKLNIGNWTWTKIRNELRAANVGVASTSLDELMRFDFRDTYDKAIAKLRAILQNTTELEPTFSHLQAVTTFVKRFNVQRKIYINPLSSFNDKFYRGNVLFQCLYDSKKRDVFAAGGRYDSLIRQNRPNTRVHDRHAVGFNLGWERLFTSMARYNDDTAKAFLKKPNDEARTGISYRRCDVLVDSVETALLRTVGIRVIQDLWAHDISAELVIDAGSMTKSTGGSQGKDVSSHTWVVLIKQDDVLKVKSPGRKEEQEIRISEMISWLRNEMRERDRSEGAAMGRVRLQRHTSQSEPYPSINASRDMEVRVLASQSKSKKSNRRTVVEDAQNRAQELSQSFLEGSIAAIETKDDIFDAIRETRLSDPESWRKLIQSVPLAERQYLSQVHDLLTDMGSENKGGKRNAFIYNFRTRACMYYDLGKSP